MSYHDLLMRYGSEQESNEVRPYIYVQQPSKLTTAEEITYRDKAAAEYITQLETIIEDPKDYRKALTERYNQLETMPYSRFLKLERKPHYRKNIEYVVTIYRIYEDKTKIRELREVFPGKERSKAMARTNELLHQNPGIPYEIDIEKQAWEK